MWMLVVGDAPDGRADGDKTEQFQQWVRRQVRRFGFSDAEADQVVDEILSAWDAMADDLHATDQGKVEAILSGLIANRCKMSARTMMRTRMRENQHGETTMLEEDEQTLRRGVLLRLDVAEALTKLSACERFICEALVQDMPQKELLKRSGLTLHRLQAAIVRIRFRFSEMGLHGWLME